MFGALVFPSCKRKEPPPKPKATPVAAAQAQPGLPADFDKLSAEHQALILDFRSRMPEWERRRPFELAQRAKDRAELVRPAPPGFKPTKSKKRIKITLMARDAKIKVGGSFWYRIELQNVGLEPISWRESDNSFFKHGDVLSYWKFRMALPDGKTENIWVDRHRWGCGAEEVREVRGMSKETRRKYIQDLDFHDKLEHGLDVTLQPGETLVTRPWQHHSGPEYCDMLKRGEDPDARIPGEFREFPGLDPFEKPGTYRIKTVYDVYALIGRPEPPSERMIQSYMKEFGKSREKIMTQYLESMRAYHDYYEKGLGRLESNAVALEVVP